MQYFQDSSYIYPKNTTSTLIQPDFPPWEPEKRRLEEYFRGEPNKLDNLGIHEKYNPRMYDGYSPEDKKAIYRRELEEQIEERRRRREEERRRNKEIDDLEKERMKREEMEIRERSRLVYFYLFLFFYIIS